MLLTDVTIDDLVSFAPAPSVSANEPAGLGVVGMPTNFIVDAQPHTATGILLEVPVTIRFTPDSNLFDYGDGSRRETRTGGRSWTALGAAQFTATPTSHAYAARGTYTARAQVRYRAELDLGRGWFPVDGLLTVPAAAVTVQVVEVHTALVEDSCLEDPRGPGC